MRHSPRTASDRAENRRTTLGSINFVVSRSLVRFISLTLVVLQRRSEVTRLADRRLSEAVPAPPASARSGIEPLTAEPGHELFGVLGKAENSLPLVISQTNDART
jgi:hypothetical protein